MSESSFNNLMDENAPNYSDEPLTSRAFKTIVYAGLTVGILDGLAAVISSALKGGSPKGVFQYIASALLGRTSFESGWASVSLGFAIHFAVAFAVAGAYFYASRKLPFLIRHPIVSGTIYGIIVYTVMQLIVKLTLAPPLPFSISGVVQGIFIHIFFVGLPIAVIVRRFSKFL